MAGQPKYMTHRPLYVWPAMHLVQALKKEKARTGSTLTHLVEEALAAKLGLSVNPDSKYPPHNPQSHILNEK